MSTWHGGDAKVLPRRLDCVLTSESRALEIQGTDITGPRSVRVLLSFLSLPEVAPDILNSSTLIGTSLTTCGLLDFSSRALTSTLVMIFWSWHLCFYYSHNLFMIFYLTWSHGNQGLLFSGSLSLNAALHVKLSFHRIKYFYQYDISQSGNIGTHDHQQSAMIKYFLLNALDELT